MSRELARQRILGAAVRTLASEGYAKTTARAIARTGGFAPGVIYYHFADLDDLFVATAHFTSEARLRRYRAETAGVTSAIELVARLRRLYAEDGTDGHIAAVQELAAASATSPTLARQVSAETARWQDFAEGVINGLVAGTALAALVPARELATAAVATYLGMEMLSHLDFDRHAHDDMFAAAERVAVLFEALRPAR